MTSRPPVTFRPPTVAGETCAECGADASGWIGQDDAPELTADFHGRVWLCDAHISARWITAARGRRPAVPGQLALNLIGDDA